MPKLSSHRTCSVTSLPGWKSPFTHRVSSKFLGLAFKDLDQASDCFFGPVHLLCSSLGCVLSHLGTASYLVPVGLLLSFLSFLKVLFIYLFFERKRGRETSMCGCLSCTPNWGPGPQSRHMPWLGIKLATLWFTGQRSIHWSTPARALLSFLPDGFPPCLRPPPSKSWLRCSAPSLWFPWAWQHVLFRSNLSPIPTTPEFNVPGCENGPHVYIPKSYT